MWKQVQQTVSYIKERIYFTPEYGVILGSGLGSFTDEMKVEFSLPYNEIPNFPVSTVQGHKGALVFGTIGAKKVVAMQGRFHYYEGYSMQQVTFPVRVMKAIGIKTLLVSNASGGVNSGFSIGDLMIINDHINFFPEHPLVGKNKAELGPRFPDMSEAYSKDLIAKAKQVAKANNIMVQEGVYLGLSGPTFETPAEYRMVKVLGADAVGMSTVPEIIVARHMNLPCFAMSIITDLGVEGKIVEVTHEDVQQVAAQSEKKMTLIMKELIKELN